MPKIIDALRPIISSWLARRITAALTAAAAVLGTSEADTQGAAAFAVAAAVFAFDCLQAWIRRRWLKPAPEVSSSSAGLTTPPTL